MGVAAAVAAAADAPWLAGLRLRSRCAGGSRATRRRFTRLQLPQQCAQLVALVERAQRGNVRRGRGELLDRQRHFEIGADGGEAARELECGEPGAQVLAHLAGDFGDAADQLVEAAVLLQQLRGRLGPDLLDSWNVVGGVADQRQVVDDLLGVDVELELHALAVEHRVGHGVDERDGAVHQLRHVLVAGGDQHRLPGARGAARERADDIVRLDAGYAQYGNPLGPDDLQQRLDL